MYPALYCIVGACYLLKRNNKKRRNPRRRRARARTRARLAGSRPRVAAPAAAQGSIGLGVAQGSAASITVTGDAAAQLAASAGIGNLECPDGYTLVCDRSSDDEVTCSCIKYGSEGEITDTTQPTGGIPTPED